jgi:hypothetical protein
MNNRISKQTQAHGRISVESPMGNGVNSSQYQAPSGVDLGKATRMIRNSGPGHLRDYTGTWWIWRN